MCFCVGCIFLILLSLKDGDHVKFMREEVQIVTTNKTNKK